MSTTEKSEMTVTVLPKNEVKRWIGIRPRVKMSAAGEARPTQVAALLADSSVEKFDLATEQDELDFVRGKWVKNGKFRDAAPDEDFTKFLPHHIVKDDEKEAAKKERPLKPTQVPVVYDGLREGDLVGMSLGGIGDCLAYAISRFGETGGFAVKRIPPFRMKDARGEASEDEDALLLATLVKEKPTFFRDVVGRDRALITLRETNRLRKFLQDDRKACFQRVRTSLIGQVFCSETGGFQEGEIEKLFDLAIANDPVAQSLRDKEKNLDKQVKKSCEQIPLYTEVLTNVKGLGPLISAPIIGAVQDIGLFDTVGKFKAFCGLHILGDGSFPRKRRGVQCNWNPSARQAFFLLGDMFNKFADGFWGVRLRENKAMYQARHPYPVLRYEADGVTKQVSLVDGAWRKDAKRGFVIQTPTGELVVASGKRDYTKGHIHKMGVWRTVSEFAEWLYFKWRTMEKYPARPPKVHPPEDASAVAAAKVEWDKTHPAQVPPKAEVAALQSAA